MDNVENVLVIFAPLFGLCVGSFLNVVIYRLPRKNLSLVFPGSHCTVCETDIPARDNIPILSWIALGGRCRFCRSPISLRYPIVELATGLMFFLCALDSFWANPAGDIGETLVLFAVKAVFLSALLGISMIDLDMRIIPDELSVGGAVFGLIVSIFVVKLHAGFQLPNLSEKIAEIIPLAGPGNVNSFLSSVLGVAAGAGGLFIVLVLGSMLFRREAMGYGDVKLMAFIGAILGAEGVLITFVIACLAGTVVGIPSKLITKSSYLPFGPYLAFGAAVTVFLEEEIIRGFGCYIDVFTGLA